MSLKRKINVSCPSCGFDQSATVWNSINSTEDPKLKRDLLKLKINSFNCQKCQKTFEIRTNLLYHEMQRKFMIWLKYPDNNDIPRTPDSEIKDFRSLLELDQPYLLRQVNSVNQLIEKIRIFDQNLDDQSIELSKLTILATYNGNENLSEDRLVFHNLRSKLFEPSELVFQFADSTYSRYQEYYVEYSYYLLIYDKLQTILNKDLEYNEPWKKIDRDFAIKVASMINSEKSNSLEENTSKRKPDGTVTWKDKNGIIYEHSFQSNELNELLKKSNAQRVFRILIKDPSSNKIIEDYWELTASQIENFVDTTSTAYCIIVYENNDRKQYLIQKNEWLKIQGYS